MWIHLLTCSISKGVHSLPLLPSVRLSLTKQTQIDLGFEAMPPRGSCLALSLESSLPSPRLGEKLCSGRSKLSEVSGAGELLSFLRSRETQRGVSERGSGFLIFLLCSPSRDQFSVLEWRAPVLLPNFFFEGSEHSRGLGHCGYMCQYPHACDFLAGSSAVCQRISAAEMLTSVFLAQQHRLSFHTPRLHRRYRLCEQGKG